MTETGEKEKRLIVGITHGDINGISYELIIKSLHDQRMLDFITPVVYGTAKVASYHRKAINVSDFSFNIIRKADQAQARKPNLVNLTDHEVKIDLGHSTPIAGELALLALENAVEDLKAGNIHVLVTAPINKKNIQSPEFHFPGHTEYLAQRFNTKDYLMLMVCPALRLGVVTGHIPVSKVPGAITAEIILHKLEVFNHSLYYDFNIRRPKIAVLGLNPHASDGGLLGDEEERLIKPAIQMAQDKGILSFGPFPADGFFGFSQYSNYDGVLAMYHDQGLIPFKALSYGEGVNFTAGLPIIRTSPAHGTAYELAGKDVASIDSFRHAIFLATDIYKNRSMTLELEANALKTNHTEEIDREGG